ncbi:MAG: ferredoxin family protein [Nitrospirae bacterium]|nr:ferredoxin family protein [Nitrospirota bacterium]
MAYVVTENCRGCRYTDCVTVCPVECFWGDGEMLYIDPETCIDCGACIPECPVEAIFADDEVPAGQEEWIGINAERCASGELVNVTAKAAALAGADARKAALGF